MASSWIPFPACTESPPAEQAVQGPPQVGASASTGVEKSEPCTVAVTSDGSSSASE